MKTWAVASDILHFGPVRAGSLAGVHACSQAAPTALHSQISSSGCSFITPTAPGAASTTPRAMSSSSVVRFASSTLLANAEGGNTVFADKGCDNLLHTPPRVNETLAKLQSGIRRNRV